MALTAKQRAFVTFYIDGGMTNAAEAYRRAYPNSKAAPRVQGIEAQRLLKIPAIALQIGNCLADANDRLKSSADRFAISKERISDHLARMGFADARKLFSWGPDGVKVLDSADLADDDAVPVIEVSHTRTAEGGTIRVKLADKRQALFDLAKLHGYVTDKVEAMMKVQEIPYDPTALTPEQREVMRDVLLTAPKTIDGKAE